MNAAPSLNLSDLNLDAERLRSLQQHVAAPRNPALFRPGAAPLLPRVVVPVIVQGAAASAGPPMDTWETIAMAQKLLNEQGDLFFLTDQKCAVGAMQRLLEQTPFGRVEEYFSFRRKAGEDDKTSPVKYSLYCPELEEDDADPLCALRALILSGEQKTLPGLRCIFHNFLHLSFFLSHPSYATCSPAFSHASMLGARTLHVKIGAFDTFT